MERLTLRTVLLNIIKQVNFDGHSPFRPLPGPLTCKVKRWLMLLMLLCGQLRFEGTKQLAAKEQSETDGVVAFVG